ncbi:polysaccharide deacetylase family protein [Xanthomarina sp. F2636L]|uniref:polysaccharide deacetylase family protein n=1 Tax=Xanthomarina sp. F2636L TaxID=2996018 RepID=UPI00225DE0CB|nr:polysaccharide deacetylase family protein [Xanthomarina sp. F2636L]MCX7549501.1 polysaccharide deacetylase family protein [Xanthomarina sp. F2636L]
MMDVSNGYFVISLDFEIHWGVFDKKSVAEYKENLENVKLVIPRLLELADKYNIKLTFATVGFLFAENKQELTSHNPKLLPNYTDLNFSPYNKLDSIGENETEDEFHYASRLIDLIKQTKKHEIGTHTYSHYYCLEDGQTKEEFEADLIAAISLAAKKGISIKSIVFPRNQVNTNYLDICSKHGITSYRGIETHKIYNTLDRNFNKKQSTRALRLIDSYLNLTGHNTYKLENLNTISGLTNIPSSTFLRPYSKKLSMFDSLKISRVKNGMTHAAKHKELFHLWWHPHNFGKHIEDNFKGLEEIFIHYKILNNNFNFNNVTMEKLASLV